MRREVDNRNKDCEFHGDYVGRDNITVNITMLQDSEREFVVTHNADIKPVSYFTGRETELEDLRQRIEEGRKSVLVSGMGGIGKTHICRKLFEEYLNKHAEDEDGPFHHIGYIEYSRDMDSSLQNCLKFRQQDVPEQNQKAAWKELENLAAGGKLLLFVDNVDKPISADPGLQKLKEIPGAIVLTSRQVSFGDEFEPYRIEFLGMEQCKEIYEKIRYRESSRKMDPEEVPDLEYVIEALVGRHTITVEFLAHLARTKLWAVKRLREELEKKGFRLEFHKDGELVNIQESYEKLYDLSELTGAEQNILEAFSVFPYIPLAAETCNEWLLADAGVSEDDDILMGLYQKGWLQFDFELESYALHPVFAQFIHEKCKPELRKHSGMIYTCQEKLISLNDDSVYECQKYISLAIYLVKNIDMGKKTQAIFIANIAALLMHTGRYQEAENCYLASIKIYEDSPEKDNLIIRDLCMGLSSVFLKQKKFREAEEIDEKIHQIERRIYGEEGMVSLNALGRLACAYNGQGKYREAEELFNIILESLGKIFVGDNLEALSACINLAETYTNLKELDKAEELLKRGIKISKEKEGEDHPDTADAYNSLAVLYMRKGEYEKAVKLFEKSKEICEQFLGEQHPDTITIYNNLASAYESHGENEKAEELYKKVLDIRISIFGQEHIDTVTSYNSLARLYMSWGRYEKAEEIYIKCLDICRKLFGEYHPNIGASYNNLALIYNRQGKLARAESMYKQSLILSKRIFGDNHPSTAICYNNLAALSLKQEEYQKALMRSLKAFIIMIKQGIRDDNTMTFFGTMVEAYKQCNLDGDFNQWLEEKMKE